MANHLREPAATTTLLTHTDLGANSMQRNELTCDA